MKLNMLALLLGSNLERIKRNVITELNNPGIIRCKCFKEALKAPSLSFHYSMGPYQKRYIQIFSGVIIFSLF